MELKDIIADSYKVFEKYHLGKSLHVCKTCCVNDEQEQILLNTPLKKLSVEQMGYYYNSATKELAEMKHFLPRVLELVNNFDFPCHSPEITFTSLDFNKSDAWNDIETELLNKFSIKFFKKCLDIYPLPNDLQIDYILVMFGIAHFDVNSILNTWLNSNHINSLLHLSDMLGNIVLVEGVKFKNPFSTKNVNETIEKWLTKKEVKYLLIQKTEKLLSENNNLDPTSEYALLDILEIFKR